MEKGVFRVTRYGEKRVIIMVEEEALVVVLLISEEEACAMNGTKFNVVPNAMTIQKKW